MCESNTCQLVAFIVEKPGKKGGTTILKNFALGSLSFSRNSLPIFYLEAKTVNCREKDGGLKAWWVARLQ